LTVNPKTFEAAGDAGPVGLALPEPYLLFLGDVTNAAYAKTALGLRDWAGERCIGEFALPAATVTTGLPAMRPADALQAGAKSLVIGIANEGGKIPASWIPALVEAIEAGLDIVSGMHVRLASVPAVRDAAERCGRALIENVTGPVNPVPGTSVTAYVVFPFLGTVRLGGETESEKLPATLSVTVVLRVIGPLVPVMVSGCVPTGVAALVDTASVVAPALDTDAGVKAALAPAGRPATSKLTVPVKPVIGVTVAV